MDVNQDGFIDIADVAALGAMIFGPGGSVQPVPAPHEQLSAWKRGDVNGDGKIDETDVDELDAYNRRAARLTAGIDSGDVNDDGRVDQKDKETLAKHLSQKQ